MTESNISAARGEVTPDRPRRVRLREVDLVTAIAIVLVVLGHVVAREPPEGNGWYPVLKDGIYLFHMPLFMFCSGTVFQHTQRRIADWGSWGTWSIGKFRRLAPGFVLIGVVITVGKVVAAEFITVDNVENDIGRGLYEVVVDPLESAVSSLWYIYVLIQFYLTVPLVLWATKQNIRAVVALGAVLHVVGLIWTLPTLFAVSRYFEYLVYFGSGMLLHAHYDSFVTWCRTRRVALGAAFSASFLVVVVVPDDVAKTIVGFASIPAAFGLVTALGDAARRPLLFIASYTYTVYLLNTLAIGVVKGVGLEFVSWDGAAFIGYFPVLFVAGLGLPILAHRWVLDRIPVLRTITR